MKTAELLKECQTIGTSPYDEHDMIEFAEYYHKLMVAVVLQQKMEEIKKVIDEVYEIRPYKKAGDIDSYSEYNEGWADACDVIESKIESLTQEEGRMNDIIEVAEKLYYEANPNTKMDVPSFAYEQVKAANNRRIKTQSELSLYDWCKKELTQEEE